MPADDWQARVRRDDISIDGLEPVLGFLALV
jgi:hypothetical protein